MGQEHPDRVILFVIDGLAVGAPDRIAMPHYNALRQHGAYYHAMHLPLAGHPDKGPDYPWTCSVPNPMLMSGTAFIGTPGIRESMIQHVFDPQETAFIVNAYSYADVSDGFGTYLSKPKQPDAISVDLTIETLAKQDLAFMRVHLQRTGMEGMKVGSQANAHQPDYQNIWHDTSGYRKAVEEADRQLGRLVEWLKSQDLWDGTLLLVCGDHGQADEGWHAPECPPSNTTPLLIAGATVQGPGRYDYCEMFDVAPTIAHAAGRKAPALSHGRILHEAFEPGAQAPAVAQNVERLNKALITFGAMPPAQQAALSDQGFLDLDHLGQWHQTPAAANFEAFTRQQEAIVERVKG